MIPMEMIPVTKPWCWSLCDFVPVELRRVASSTPLPFAFPIVQLFTMEDEPSTLNVPKQVYRDGPF